MPALRRVDGRAPPVDCDETPSPVHSLPTGCAARRRVQAFSCKRPPAIATWCRQEPPGGPSRFALGVVPRPSASIRAERPASWKNSDRPTAMLTWTHVSLALTSVWRTAATATGDSPARHTQTGCAQHRDPPNGFVELQGRPAFPQYSTVSVALRLLTFASSESSTAVTRACGIPLPVLMAISPACDVPGVPASAASTSVLVRRRSWGRIEMFAVLGLSSAPTDSAGPILLLACSGARRVAVRSSSAWGGQGDARPFGELVAVLAKRV
jgi:hypothetical protein